MQYFVNPDDVSKPNAVIFESEKSNIDPQKSTEISEPEIESDNCRLFDDKFTDTELVT